MAAAFFPRCALQGATESNNMVIKGVPSFYRKRKGNHIITTEIVRALGCPAMCFAPKLQRGLHGSHHMPLTTRHRSTSACWTRAGG